MKQICIVKPSGPVYANVYVDGVHVGCFTHAVASDIQKKINSSMQQVEKRLEETEAMLARLREQKDDRHR